MEVRRLEEQPARDIQEAGWRVHAAHVVDAAFVDRSIAGVHGRSRSELVRGEQIRQPLCARAVVLGDPAHERVTVKLVDRLQIEDLGAVDGCPGVTATEVAA